MAVKASVTITISKYRDTSSITRYYKLQASTASKPAKPTTLTPSGWTDTEPTYTSGSTNTLYFVDRYVFSDGTFQYTEVSKSTSYEAAKEAYNKAQAAQNSATSANNKIDNLEIGGRNLAWNTKEMGISSAKNNRYCNTYSGPLIHRNDGFGEIKCVSDWHGIGMYANALNLKIGDRLIFQCEVNSYFASGKVSLLLMESDSSGNRVYKNAKLYASNGYIFEGNSYNIITTNSGNTNIVWIGIEWTSDLKELIDNGGTIRLTFQTHSITKEDDGGYIGLSKLKLEYGNIRTDWTPAPEDIEGEVNDVSKDLAYFKETTFTSYKRDQEINDQAIKNRLSRTEVTVYGDPEDPDDPKALINHVQKVDNDLNGAGGAIDRIEAAEGTIDGTGLNEYDQRIKISQRFLDIETDVESIKNIFNITGGTNLIQNSVGYFASNDNKPTMWDITSNTIYKPFGYDGDLTGITVSRGRLFCAKGSIKTTANNIIALLSNKMISISFKYKNGANATSKIKIFNGSTVYFEKTFNTAVNRWTEYRFNPDTDPVLANPTFLNTSNSLQISIESTNSTNNNGFEISDLMLNYGNVKPWELSSNEVYGAMVKLSSLGIEVTATTANTKNFMTTDGILVYRYDSKTDTIIGTEPITKITDNGTVTNKLESTGDIIERNLIQTMIKDSSNNDVYVEYIR